MRTRRKLPALVVAALVLTPVCVSTQGTLDAVVELVEAGERQRTVVQIGRDVTVPVNERVQDVVVIAGSAAIDGEVTEDVVVIGGAAHLSRGATVNDLVVIGGSVSVEPGAVVRSDLVLMGGKLDAPPGFAPGGEHVALEMLFSDLEIGAVLPWFQEGLFWGRPVVPRLAWLWLLIAVVFVLYLLINAVFDRPVRACIQVLADRPATTGAAGLLVLLGVGPFSIVLILTLVGIAVLPFLLLLLAIGGLLGRIGVMRWLGSRLVPESASGGLGVATRSLAIGFGVVGIAYMVPLLGVAAWATLSVFGLGAAVTAFVSALRGEVPPRPDPAPIPVPTVPNTDHEAAAASPSSNEAAGNTSETANEPLDGVMLQRAAFRYRAGSFGLDLLLLAIVMIMSPLDGASTFLLLCLGYHVGFWAWRATTIGGIICRIRIVRLDGTSIRFNEAVVRGLSSLFSLAVLGLGWFWAIGDPERQAWHDRIAGTYVVRVPPGWPVP